jgi:hypothetical protein
MTTTHPSTAVNKKNWLPWHKSTSMWTFFKLKCFLYSMNSSKPQQMRCVVYHNIHQEKARQNNTHLHKGFITSNKDHQTITMSRHVFTKHFTRTHIRPKNNLLLSTLVLMPNSFPKSGKI